MKLIFEKSAAGRGCTILPPSDVPAYALAANWQRAAAPRLPEIAETDISRHYTELTQHTHGVSNGFYPLGSCTMKYNPRINEEFANHAQFTGIHPLQPADTVQGCREVLALAEQYLCELTGMDAMSFQPAAGAHGEFLGLLLIKAYHESRQDTARTKIIVPDSAHGTNPASATMLGYEVVTIPSAADGCVDLAALKAKTGPDTAGLMLTNPNTLGLFDKNILEITQVIHDAGGLVYYDGANLNAVMGIARPGDLGFDVVHLNVHKTLSTPHGGGGPGGGPVGCKEILKPFLPVCAIADGGEGLQVKAFYGHFLVTVRALTYVLTLGAEGLREASETAVLNANYLMKKLAARYDIAYEQGCMHEFVISAERLKKETGVAAMDIAKALIDHDIHPPTMYFPLIVNEALMVEPTETESRETLDRAAEIFLELYETAYQNPQAMLDAPITTPVRRPDEVLAARNPVLAYQFPAPEAGS